MGEEVTALTAQLQPSGGSPEVRRQNGGTSPHRARYILTGRTALIQSVLLALPYAAVTEELLQLENKLSCLEEVTQKTRGQARSFC